MLPSTITLTKEDGTTTEDFVQISTAGLRTTRAVSGLELDEPKELVVSHELSKDKSRTSSVVILTDTQDIGTADVPVLGSAKVMLKVQYDNKVMTAQQIKDAIAQVISLFQTTGYVDKLLNRES